MARIPFVRHRTVNQLWNRYRACREGVEKTRWHAVWLLARTDTPRTPAQVADVVGLSDVTVREVLHRWNADGPAGLRDGRAGNGSQPKLTARRRDALYAALQKRPPDGGLWTGPKVGRYVASRWGVTVDPTTGWRWLRDLGFTLQVPRPSHPRSAGDHQDRCSTPEGVTDRFTCATASSPPRPPRAQRPKASLIGSPSSSPSTRT